MRHNKYGSLPCPHCGRQIELQLARIRVEFRATDTTQKDISNFEPTQILNRILEAIFEDCDNNDLLEVLEEKLTAKKREKVCAKAYSKDVDQRFDYAPKMSCPHCANFVTLTLDVIPITFFKTSDILAVHGPDLLLDKSIVHNNGETLSIAAQRLIRECMDNGVFKGFQEAFELNHKKNMPKNIHHQFVKFLETTKKGWPRNDIFGKLTQEFTNSKLEFWSSSGVGVILLDGAIYRFVPMQFMKDSIHETSLASQLGIVSKKKIRKTNDEANQKNDWVRSKMGYVPFDSPVFFSELQKRSIGAFDNIR